MNRRAWFRSCLLIFAGAGLFAQGRLTVTVLDFKTHGLSAVLQTPGGKVWLLDTALRPTGDYYAARDAIAPFLKVAGVKALDGVLISHPHGDHYGGLPYLMENYRIGQLVDAGYDGIGGSELEIYRKIRGQYVAGGGKSVIVRIGAKIALDPALDAEILWPPQEIRKSDPSKPDESLYNANSIVLRVRHGANVLLFPGDQHGITNMAKVIDPEKLKCDILVAPHHGINSTPAMAAITKPKIVIAASLKEYPQDDKPAIHPYELTKQAFAAVGSKVYSTWAQGDITVVSDGQTLKIRTASKP